MTGLVPPQRYVSPEKFEAEKVRTEQQAIRSRRAQAMAWVNIVFPEQMRRTVARIPRNQLDWSIAAEIVQVLYERDGDLYLLDRVRGKQICVDTDIGQAWGCPLDAWGSREKYAAHLNTDDLVFIFL